jgi:hypothetical protein
LPAPSLNRSLIDQAWLKYGSRPTPWEGLLFDFRVISGDILSRLPIENPGTMI